MDPYLYRGLSVVELLLRLFPCCCPFLGQQDDVVDVVGVVGGRVAGVSPLDLVSSVKDKPLELRVYSGLRRQAFTARLGLRQSSGRVLGSEYSTFRPAFEYSARNTRLFGRPSNTRLGILDFSADLRILGSEYSTFFAELPSVITI